MSQISNYQFEEFKRLEYATSIVISRRELALLGGQVRFDADYLLDCILCQFRGYLWAESKTSEIKVPLTWWDHLKQRLGWQHRTRTIYQSINIVRPDVRDMIDGPYLRKPVRQAKWEPEW